MKRLGLILGLIASCASAQVSPLNPSSGSGGSIDTSQLSTSANQTSEISVMSGIRTALGLPFQAGGSIGNTTFGATQSGTWSNVGVTGIFWQPTQPVSALTLPLPANASNAIIQAQQLTAEQSTQANTAVAPAPYKYGYQTITLNAASQAVQIALPGSGGLEMRVSGTCTDTVAASINFANSPDTSATVLGSARLYKNGVGSLGRAYLSCMGAMSGGYRLVTGGYAVNIGTSSTFSGSITVTYFGSAATPVVFVSGAVHTTVEEALRAGRSFIVSTQMQNVSAGSYVIGTLSNPAGSGVNIFVYRRMFQCNQGTGNTPVEWNTYSNPTIVPTTTVALVNLKPGDTNASVSTFKYQVVTSAPTMGGVQGDSGPVRTGGGADIIEFDSMIIPGGSVGFSITGGGGGLSAAQRCKGSYLEYEEPIN